MTPVRLGAVSYLNARPLVFGLGRSARFSLRYDLPSECARLLEAGEIDLGLVPSIEYLRDDAYRIVPGMAITSFGPVTSVALYTSRPIRDVRTVVMDTSSRTSVALVRVLCARLFRIQPAIEAQQPDLDAMLTRGDAALVIGDNALLWDHTKVRLPVASSAKASAVADSRIAGGGSAAVATPGVEKIDLGSAWTSMTGLPFVWAFWTGRAGALDSGDVTALKAARDAGVAQREVVARDYFRDNPEHQEAGIRYLRDNIKYDLGGAERAALELFYRYAVETGVMPATRPLLFY
jgi:chorismate dehydratase